MKSVTALIAKLGEIHQSIGIEDNFTVLNQVLDAQDFALQVQAEVTEMFRVGKGPNEVEVAPDASSDSQTPLPGWRRAFASILPVTAVSSEWKR